MIREHMLDALRVALDDHVARADVLRRVDALPTDGIWSADHVTLAEAHYRNGIVAVLDELAPSTREAFDQELARTRAYIAFLPKVVTFERTKGKGSSHVPIVEPCPSCGRGGVHYEGSDVIEGSLEMNHLVHTEVKDLFACVSCGWEWSEPRFI